MDAYELGRQGIYIQLGIFDKLKSSRQGAEREAAFNRTASTGSFDPSKDPTGAKMRKAKADQFATNQRKKKLQATQAKRAKAQSRAQFARDQGAQVRAGGKKAHQAQQAAKAAQAAQAAKPAATAGAQAGRAGMSGSVMKHLKKNRLTYGAGALGLGAMSMLN
jgi:hypothetical protein